MNIFSRNFPVLYWKLYTVYYLDYLEYDLFATFQPQTTTLSRFTQVVVCNI